MIFCFRFRVNFNFWGLSLESSTTVHVVVTQQAASQKQEVLHVSLNSLAVMQKIHRHHTETSCNFTGFEEPRHKKTQCSSTETATNHWCDDDDGTAWTQHWPADDDDAGDLDNQALELSGVRWTTCALPTSYSFCILRRLTHVWVGSSS